MELLFTDIQDKLQTPEADTKRKLESGRKKIKSNGDLTLTLLQCQYCLVIRTKACSRSTAASFEDQEFGHVQVAHLSDNASDMLMFKLDFKALSQYNV